MAPSRARAANGSTLLALLRAELAAGILGLRLFMACVAVATFMLGSVWLLAAGLSQSLEENGRRILGGDVAVELPNAPLDKALTDRLAGIGRLSRTAELRTSAAVGDERATIELKAVDEAYPLYGSVGLDGTTSLRAALEGRGGRPGAVVEAASLSRFGARLGDIVTIGQTEFEIAGVLILEPDRLSAGSFLVGPRVIIDFSRLEATGLTGPGSLAEYHYRLRVPDDMPQDAAVAAVSRLAPERGWQLRTPRDAAERVRRTAERTTTFLGVAGIVALAIGLAGAWVAATVWVSRRSRTIALYRLSGATPGLVTALHAVIMAVAGAVGLAVGLAIAVAVAAVKMGDIAAQLHLAWNAAALVTPAVEVAVTMVLGLAGASAAALSAAARTPPAAAMRSIETAADAAGRHVVLGGGTILLAMALAVTSLPVPGLAAVAAAGLIAAAALLALAGWALARLAARRRPRSFVGLVTLQGLAIPGAAATKALAIGIGIAGITSIVSAQHSLERALRTELPQKLPALVLLDVRRDQVETLRQRIAGDAALGGLQATPYLRATILAVNGVPAAEALVRPDKSWVIEGDRSFSWAAEPTGAELLAGEWWPPDYDGAPLLSPEEDVLEAFDLKPGDRMTYSVLGRTFTSPVVNIRKEYHRTFRPEFLLVASPRPFRDAPHSWIMSVQGSTDAAVDALIRDLSRSAPNVTAIDVRRIVAQVTEIIDGAVLGTLAVALALLAAGALSLTAVIAADVDARRREALAFTLVGAARREIALARLAEAAGIGALAAVLGGIAGHVGGWWLVDEALRVAWAPGILSYLLPAALGIVAALAAGAAGGLGAVPRGRGQVVRHLAG